MPVINACARCGADVFEEPAAVLKNILKQGVLADICLC